VIAKKNTKKLYLIIIIIHFITHKAAHNTQYTARVKRRRDVSAACKTLSSTGEWRRRLLSRLTPGVAGEVTARLDFIKLSDWSGHRRVTTDPFISQRQLLLAGQLPRYAAKS